MSLTMEEIMLMQAKLDELGALAASRVTVVPVGTAEEVLTCHHRMLTHDAGILPRSSSCV